LIPGQRSLATGAVAALALATWQCGGGVVDTSTGSATDSATDTASSPVSATSTDETTATEDGTDGSTEASSGLPPIDPACATSDDADLCWGEWLKRTAVPEQPAVPVGALGPVAEGTPPLQLLAEQEGLSRELVGVGSDVAGNVYAVSSSALFVRRVGDDTFVRYAAGTSGLGEDPFLSVAGAAAGVAYVGAQGVFGADPETETEAQRRSGDIAEVRLVPGAIDVHRHDTHNSNAPHSGKYDHSRSIYGIVVPRRGPAAGELYLATEHGVVRGQTPELYADHRHVATMVNGSQRFGASGALTVGDDGTLWYGNEYAYGGLAYTPRLYEWYFDNPWLSPGYAFLPEGSRVPYEGAGVDSGGAVWLAARGHGLARLTRSASGRTTVETFSVPDAEISDLVVDLDDTLWLATTGGVYRGRPGAGGLQRVAGVEGRVNDLFLDDLTVPRTVWMATERGLAAWRGP